MCVCLITFRRIIGLDCWARREFEWNFIIAMFVWVCGNPIRISSPHNHTHACACLQHAHSSADPCGYFHFNLFASIISICFRVFLYPGALFPQVVPAAVIKYEPVKDKETKLMARTVGLHISQLGPEHFVKGKLTVSVMRSCRTAELQACPYIMCAAHPRVCDKLPTTNDVHMSAHSHPVTHLPRCVCV